MSEESISFSSESSSGSQNQTILMFKTDKDDNPFSSPTHRLNRTGTVKRSIGRSSLPDKNMDDLNQCVPDSFKSPEKVGGSGRRERYRRSLDATYRRSLDSISEYKPKRSFSSCLVPGSSSRDCSSIDSSSSDYTDYAQHRSSTTDSSKDTTVMSTTSSTYVSWLENVSQDIVENTFGKIDTLDGEWNSFWSQYTNPLNKHLSCFTTCNEEKSMEESSDCKSTCSIKEFQDKQSSEDKISFSHNEITEALQCCQKIIEILQTALKRFEDAGGSPGGTSNVNAEVEKEGKSKCPFSLDPRKRQQIVKKPIYSSNSYLNALFTSGVADVLKKMLNKRRSFTSDEPCLPRSRSSCSE